MVAGELLADVGQAQVGELADEVHGHLASLGGVFVLLGAAEDGLVDGVALCRYIPYR